MNDRQNFVNTAISYLGVVEGSEKHKYIVDTYNQIRPLPAGYQIQTTDSWCAAFVSFCAHKCGLLNIIPAECSCNRIITLAKNMGIWVENDVYVPKPGEIILYDWNDNGIGDNTGVPDHIGIVVSVSNGMIKVIEGNYRDAVGYRNIAINGKFIRGFICPKFASDVDEKPKEMCSVELKVLRQGSRGNSVKALQLLLAGNNCSYGSSGADGDFGPATLSAVKKYQKLKGLSIDGIVGKNTWSALLS